MVYVISDLHGYPLEKLQQLLDKASFSDEDYCFVLGDVIDRGEHGVALLEWLMYQPNIQLILGNHEAMMLACRFLFQEVTEETVAELSMEKMELYSTWLSNGGQPTIRALAGLDEETRNDIFEFLSEAPIYDTLEIAGKEYLLTHSGIDGFSPEKKLSQYPEDAFLWNRPKPDDTYYDDRIVVFGHTPTHCIIPENKGEVIFTKTWIAIDTGAAQGLSPTLLCLDTMTAYSGI